MPGLDRRVTVRRTRSVRDQQGETVETVTEHRVWASRMDVSAIDVEQEGGVLDVATRGYRIRWRSDLADVPASELAVVDGGIVFDVTNVVEASGPGAERRRFLTLEGVGGTE